MTIDERIPATENGTWQAYSSTPDGRAANRSMQGKAESLRRKLAKIEAEGRLTRRTARAALLAFVKAWHRMGTSKSYCGSGITDTEPRCAVADHCDAVWLACFGTCASELWDELQAAAYEDLRDEKKRRHRTRYYDPQKSAPRRE